MAQVDFTKEELLSDVRELMKEELASFEPRVREIVDAKLSAFEPRMYEKVKKIVKLEVMESEGRIKQDIKHFCGGGSARDAAAVEVGGDLD